MTPRAWLFLATRAANDEQWERASAYAAVGMLSLQITAIEMSPPINAAAAVGETW